MGMDASAGDFQVSMNWSGWSELQAILERHGFQGKLPNFNDGEMVSRETAQGVGEAMLRFYMQKDREDPECKLPALSRHECACLAYALLLCLHDGRVEHF